MKFFTNMFEAWFKRKFDTKCKVNINMLLMRIEYIKRRRNAMQKFLRSDIAELLKIGYDSDAYRRVGRLYLDQNRTLCYDFVARFCTLISDQLVKMNDQSECPDECKEAVSSLMYAAARFGDLPELRKLRTLFSERYRDSLEPFVNQVFAELLKPNHPTKDMKIRLMQEIAQEHGVEWDPESLDNRLYTSNLSGNAGEDQDQEPCMTDSENRWMINIQETINDDSNARKKDEMNYDLIKQTEKVRQRILDYWSRTTSLLSTSRDSSTSPDESSSSSDEASKSRPFFNFRLMPPSYVKNNRDEKERKYDILVYPETNNVDKENGDVLNHPTFEKLNDEKDVAAPRTMKNRWWRKGDTLPRLKLHPVENLLNSTSHEERIGNVRVGSYQPDLTANPPKGHVHPKLPDYDEIKARFAAHRAKS